MRADDAYGGWWRVRCGLRWFRFSTSAALSPVRISPGACTMSSSRPSELLLPSAPARSPPPTWGLAVCGVAWSWTSLRPTSRYHGVLDLNTIIRSRDFEAAGRTLRGAKLNPVSGTRVPQSPDDAPGPGPQTEHRTLLTWASAGIARYLCA